MSGSPALDAYANGASADRKLRAILSRFLGSEEHYGVTAFGAGLIHQSFRVLSTDASNPGYLLQKINRRAFSDPRCLMENIRRVTVHQENKLRPRRADWKRRCLRLVPSLSGSDLVEDEDGEFWRMFHFIQDSRSFHASLDPDIARRAAHAFGHFVANVSDLPGPPLHDVIPGFHDTMGRLRALEAAAVADVSGRARGVGPELEELLGRGSLAAPICELAASPDLPRRVVHNDTKIDNVLFDSAGRDALCVVDLDTATQGTPLYDFGDLVRSTATPATSAAPSFRIPLFEDLLDGYLAGIGRLICRSELELIHLAPSVVAMELAARFLTDYLDGDRYFAITRFDQNLDRCRAQLALLKSMEAQIHETWSVVQWRLRSVE